jgi:hypothetical protein
MASFPVEEDASPETLVLLFAYGNYSIKFSPLDTGHTLHTFGFSLVLFCKWNTFGTKIWKSEKQSEKKVVFRYSLRQESGWLLTFNVPVMHVRFMRSNDIISTK